MRALISGFYISGEPGKQLAQIKELHNSDVVWSFPIFTLSIVDNPAPLLLYDELLIDDRVSPLTIDFIFNNIERIGTYENTNLERNAQALTPQELENRASLLEELFNSEIYSTIRIENLLTPDDINSIGRNARAKIQGNDDWFKGEVDQLKLVYGPHYAAPNPISFEAMNTELLWRISEKLSEENSDTSIFDDCVRGNIYKRKIYELVSENIRKEVISRFWKELPTYLVGLPKIRLENVEQFIELHQSNEIRQFRQVVTAISLEKNRENRDRLIKRELYQANDALFSTHNETDFANLLGVVLNIGATAATFIQNSNWLSGLGFASASFIAFSVLKQMRERLSRRQRFSWFVRLKSFAESQARFDEQLEMPWHLPEL